MASFGRAGFGGLLRFGDQVSPYLRLGIGLQGASFNAEFTEGPEPESSLEFTELLTFGAGVDTRIGSNVLIGLAGTVNRLGRDDQLSVNVGLHLSYGWNQ